MLTLAAAALLLAACSSGPAQPHYPDCAAVQAAGKAPLHRGQPSYRPALDRDDDGIACDTTD
jgi:uncharacterized lipoprotein YmbA